MPYRIEDILNKSKQKAVPNVEAPASTTTQPSTEPTIQPVVESVVEPVAEPTIEPVVESVVRKKGYSILRHGNQEVLIKLDKKKSIKEAVVSYKEKLGLPTLSSTTVNKLIRVYSNNGTKVSLDDILKEESELLLFVNHKEKG